MKEEKDLVSDLLQANKLFANNYLSDVLFIFTSDSARSDGSTVTSGDKYRNAIAGEDHLIPAHRLILSLRSGAFQFALQRAKSSQVPGQVRFPLKIHVQDTPYCVFYSLLRFLYTNELGTEDRDDKKQQDRDEFWLQLLRAAFVYLVPSLVDICVKRIMAFLVVEEEMEEEEEESGENDDDNKARCLQKKTLDVLVFVDTVLSTNPLTARRRKVESDITTLTPPSLQNGRRTGAEEETNALMLSRCTVAVHELQNVCVQQLQLMDEVTFGELIQSETGGQCSTERLCEILRLRSDTPLVVAVRYQLGRVVNELLRLGEPLNRVGNDETDLPLVVALQTGNNAIIRRLLVDESAPFFLLTDTVPLIFLASASGNVQHCEILIEQNFADVNLISQLKDGDKEITAEFGYKQTPLHIASRKGHSAVVELLLQHNAAANLPDEEGNTALHYAANIETVEVLLNSAFQTNANIPNRRGRTPLHIAAARGDVAVVAYLIRHGADQDIVDDQGQNAFHHAAAHGQTAVTLVLLHENGGVNGKMVTSSTDHSRESNETTDESQSDTSQRLVNQTGSGIGGEDVDELDEVSGFDINQEDVKGNTALHLAAMSPPERCQKMLQLLLENGADPNKANWFGYTPLHLFCSHQSGPASLLNSFIEHGVNIHAQSLDGSTALHLVVGRGSQDVAVTLVSAGAFVHLLDAAGRSVVDLLESTNQGAMLVPVLRNLSRPPEWIGDEQTTECSSCHTTFRLAMRKHRCRHCGRTVCYNCSSHKIAIPKFQVLKPDRDVLPSASASIAVEKTLQELRNGDEFFVTANIIGVSLHCVVNPQWPCEAILGTAAEVYHATFTDSEVPECNVVFHRKKQEFLVAGTPISECCARGDELELGVTLPALSSVQGDVKSSVAPSRDCTVDTNGETSEFCVLFHKLPLGFTMKRGNDNTTEIGTIYPKSAATHFPRLAPGVTIVSIAGTPLQDMGLRQVHDLIKNAKLPLDIHFQGREEIVSPLLSPDTTQEQRVSEASSAIPLVYQQGGRRRGPADHRSVRSNGSNGSGRSRNSRSSGRGKKKTGDSVQQQGINTRQKSGKLHEQNQHPGRQKDEAFCTVEAELVEQIEHLKVALLRKHEEAKHIARQLESCSEKLLALRGESGGTTVLRQQQQQQNQQCVQNGTAYSHRTAATSKNKGGSKFRLTPEVLEAMDQKAGLPQRGTGAYTSSNVSSISGYSAQSMPAARSANMRARSARMAIANADNVSVSSYTSNSSNTSARRGGKNSPRGTTLRNLSKRYNYMPQKYATSTTSASEAGSTSLSSRGAVMSRARISRDSFITKSESPGVGYYDVKVKDHVKGGEIGDSSRSLQWS
ncbi:hypothetical protein DD238_002156 [Peronospora effusa]|uniref:FYVE-type domain-containing protein n=1 Tax=Peronospora effusa TaxID=542832 RepID=A0A3M6VKT9_9STRA|nr:hypothetical protein DD238_002156 [Peronospora effusa]